MQLCPRKSMISQGFHLTSKEACRTAKGSDSELLALLIWPVGSFKVRLYASNRRNL